MLIAIRGRSQTTFTRFGFFWPPTPLRLHFLWYKSFKKVDFFHHLPPSSCKGSLWTAPNFKSTGIFCQMFVALLKNLNCIRLFRKIGDYLISKNHRFWFPWIFDSRSPQFFQLEFNSNSVSILEDSAARFH